jgi:signal transduction histidine kinase
MGQMSACFAHEVSNPLTLIRGHLRFIDESLSADHPVRANLDVLDRASRRMEEMAKHMLDFGRKKASRVSECDVSEIVDEALRFMDPYIRANFIVVEMRLGQQLPQVSVDRWQIIQAIVNILQNAGEAMKDTNPRILSIQANAVEERLRIVVSDTGTGIASDDLPYVFEPFFTKKGDGGTGLGLFITRQVIQEHRGSIEIRNENPGTSFIISLPL